MRVAYLCDVDERLYPDGVPTSKRSPATSPQTFFDIRKLLEQKDLDAVSIATPDHWHALPTIWACQAGKDVYCRKACQPQYEEGRKMVEAARKYNRIVQAGLNRRSDHRNKAGARFVQEDKFGAAYRAKAVVYPRPHQYRTGAGSIHPARACIGTCSLVPRRTSRSR